jgi:epsilon-lactone hydrolase
MPSLTARIVGFLLRTTGIFSKRYADRASLDRYVGESRKATPQLPSAKLRAKVAVSERQLDGRSVWEFAPKAGAPAGHLLYFHGGGYVYAAVDVHWGFLGGLAEQHGLAITAPLYPLAPEAGAVETAAFALAAYRDFLARHDGPFVLGGDSAGAGLAAATIMAARDAGLRLPDGLLLICPWLDGTASHPDQPAIERRDSILRIPGIRAAAEMYARDLPVTDPKISPINGDWSGMPQIFAFGGGDDILVTDARALKAKLPAVEYDERAGLMHDWPLFFLPESRDAQAKIARFVQSPSVLANHRIAA